MERPDKLRKKMYLQSPAVKAPSLWQMRCARTRAVKNASSDISESERNLDNVPQIVENEGHGSDTYNNEFRPAGTDY